MLTWSQPFTRQSNCVLTSSSKGGYTRFLPVLLTYAICLIFLLPKQSLWLDELLDLIGARLPNFPDLIYYVRITPGAAPLGYLAQAVTIKIFGLSAFSGRLPSALSSVASCAGVYFLASRTGSSRPLLAVLAFAICPLQFRYALEARGYALALAFSIGSTLLFFMILERPKTVHLPILYGLCVLAGLYTQPFSVFVPLAHLAWLIAVMRGRLMGVLSITLLVSGLLFLPWYSYASGAWKESIRITHLQGELSGRTMAMVLRELVGMGYVGTAVVLIAIILAGISWNARRSDFLFWLLYVLIPIVCVFAADRTFGYFLASRQMIFVVAPLSVLFALGIQQRSRLGFALGLAFLIGALWNDVKLLQRPREDWQSAARLLKREANDGRCVFFSPEDSLQFYTFFLPELAESRCTEGNWLQAGGIALAVSPYDLDRDRLRIEHKLNAAGFFKRGELNSIGPRIEVFAKSNKE